MHLRMRQILECPVCLGPAGSNDEHLEIGCPRAKMAHLQDEATLKTLNCPTCRGKFSVDLNCDDFFECRECSAQFSSSIITDDPNAKPIYMLGYDEAIQVLPLKQKGKGKFKIDQIVERLQLSEKTWRK